LIIGLPVHSIYSSFKLGNDEAKEFRSNCRADSSKKC